MRLIVMSLLRMSAVLIFAGQLISPLWAQDGGSPAAGPPYPGGSQITFLWDYSCPGGKGCSFRCSEGGAGGASHVTKLTIYLGTVPVGNVGKPAIFYNFSTTELPRSNGFTVNAGLSTLSCQVNGMTLDYSGSPKGPLKFDGPFVGASTAR